MDRKLTAVALATVLVVSTLGVAAAGSLDGTGAQAGNDSQDGTETPAGTETSAGTETETATATDTQAETDAQTDDVSTATVSASGTGQVTAQPDRAVVYLVVSATGENATEATDTLAANVSTLREALDDESLPVVSVNTTGYSVGPLADDGGAQGPGDGGGDGQADDRTYVASQAFAVTTDDVDAAGWIVDAGVAAGADEVRGVQFTLSDERREALRTDAIDRAVSDARAQAEAAADSAGLSLAGVRSLSVDGGGVPVGFQQAEAAAAGGTTIDPTPVVVAASVQVTYEATGE